MSQEIGALLFLYGGAVVGWVIAMALLYFLRMSEYRASLRRMEEYLRDDQIARTARSILHEMKPYLRADADHQSLLPIILTELLQHHGGAKTYVVLHEPQWGPE